LFTTLAAFSRSVHALIGLVWSSLYSNRLNTHQGVSTRCRHPECTSTRAKYYLLLLLLQPFYSSLDFVWDYPGEPVPEETFTHSHVTPILIINHHLSTSSIYCNPWHHPCSIYMSDSLCTTCVQVFQYL